MSELNYPNTNTNNGNKTMPSVDKAMDRVKDL
jgi:hypothetical protein